MKRIGIFLGVGALVTTPVFADENIPLSTPGLSEACKLFPDKPLSEATVSSAFPNIRCEWLSEVKVEGERIRGGTAGVDTSDIRELYDIFKEVQNQYSETFGSEPGVTIQDENNVIDCTESRMVIVWLNGVPTHSHFTSWCGGVGINFVTVGADYTEEGSSKFGQVVRSIMGDKVKK